MRLSPALVAVLVACGAKRIVTTRRGPSATVGCLDVIVSARVVDSSPTALIRFDFANRCDVQTTVDLGSVRVVARDVAGGHYALEPFDPRGEIRALPIDAVTWGDELIEYRATDSLADAIDAICVDVAAVDGRGPRKGKWICAPRTTGVW